MIFFRSSKQSSILKGPILNVKISVKFGNDDDDVEDDVVRDLGHFLVHLSLSSIRSTY